MKHAQGLDVTPSAAHDEDGTPYWRHDDDYSIAFFRISAGGRVHVRGGYENAKVFDPETQAAANLYNGKVVALCGKKVAWHKAAYLSHFPDDLLCRGCHTAFPDDTNLLFEHET